MNRLTFIDAAKGLGIILVVLGHTQEPKLLTLILYSFHMPLFFSLAGFTFNQLNYSNSSIWRKKASRLILPYFVSNIFFYCYWFIMERGLSKVSPVIAALGVLNGNAAYIETNATLWFLPTLFCSEIILYYLIGFLNSKKEYEQLLIVMMFSLSGYLFSTIYVFPWGLDVAFVAQLFLFVGYKIRQKNIFKEQGSKSYLFNIGLIIALAVGIYLNGKVDMASRHYGNIFLFFINGLLGSFLVLLLSQAFKGYLLKIMSFLGRNSLAIFIFHTHAFKILNNVGLSLRYWPIFVLWGTLIPITLNKPFNKLLNIILDKIVMSEMKKQK